MRIQVKYLLFFMLLIVSCGDSTCYERLQDAIITFKSTSETDGKQGHFVEFELLADVAYLDFYKAPEGNKYAAKCQQVISVPQDLAKMPKTLQTVLQSCHFVGCVYQFICDDFWDNKYPDSILYACLDDEGSLRVFYTIEKS